jgi:DNA-binding MarR family transcriptional regulator
MKRYKLFIPIFGLLIFNFCIITLSYSSLNSNIQSDGLEITYPNGGEVLSGNVTITWTLESAYAASVKSYTIYYSPNNGQNWNLLGNVFLETNYDWNTDLYVEYGTQYLIRILASSMEWTEKEAISESTFTIDNREINLIGLMLIIAAIGTLGLGSYYFYTKRNKQSSFASFFQLVKSGFIEEPLELPSIEIDAIIEPTSMIEYFPTDFQYDLRSEIKGRTILTLIEIAYQNPSDTNPAKIAKSLNIPPSTLSKEIKKLKELDYLQTHISTQVVQDARYRNFQITSKGFHFLSLLNTALKVTLNRVKMNGRIE